MTENVADKLDLTTILEELLRRQYEKTFRHMPEAPTYAELDPVSKMLAKQRILPSLVATIEVVYPHIRRLIEAEQFEKITSNLDIPSDLTD